jgi:hypothetical protein
MIKNILVACTLAISTLLAGCAGTATEPPGTVTTQPDFAAIIAQVQGYTRTACGFVPTAASIISVLTAGNPGVIAGTAIAEAICGAIAPQHGAGRNAFVAKSVKGWRVTPGAVNGVSINGDRAQ